MGLLALASDPFEVPSTSPIFDLFRRKVHHLFINLQKRPTGARILAADPIHDIMGRVVQQVDTEAPGFRRLTTPIQTQISRFSFQFSLENMITMLATASI